MLSLLSQELLSIEDLVYIRSLKTLGRVIGIEENKYVVYVFNRGMNLLDREDLTNNLIGVDLRWAILKIVNLRLVDLTKADLREANLWGVNLREANLEYANLYKAILRGADLRYANLEYANLREADLRGANLYRANLREVDLREAIGIDKSRINKDGVYI